MLLQTPELVVNCDHILHLYIDDGWIDAHQGSCVCAYLADGSNLVLSRHREYHDARRMMHKIARTWSSAQALHLEDLKEDME